MFALVSYETNESVLVSYLSSRLGFVLPPNGVVYVGIFPEDDSKRFYFHFSPPLGLLWTLVVSYLASL